MPLQVAIAENPEYNVSFHSYNEILLEEKNTSFQRMSLTSELAYQIKLIWAPLIPFHARNTQEQKMHLFLSIHGYFQTEAKIVMLQNK